MLDGNVNNFIMEKLEKLKYQLFIGMVSDIIGLDKTIALLKEAKEVLDKNNTEKIIEGPKSVYS